MMSSLCSKHILVQFLSGRSVWDVDDPEWFWILAVCSPSSLEVVPEYWNEDMTMDDRAPPLGACNLTVVIPRRGLEGCVQLHCTERTFGAPLLTTLVFLQLPGTQQLYQLTTMMLSVEKCYQCANNPCQMVLYSRSIGLVVRILDSSTIFWHRSAWSTQTFQFLVSCPDYFSPRAQKMRSGDETIQFYA